MGAKLLLLYQFFCPRERNVGEWCDWCSPGLCSTCSDWSLQHYWVTTAAEVSLCTLELGVQVIIHQFIRSDSYLYLHDHRQVPS